MTPRLAVAVNLAQLVALANHSKLSLSDKQARETLNQLIAGLRVWIGPSTEAKIPKLIMPYCYFIGSLQIQEYDYNLSLLSFFIHYAYKLLSEFTPVEYNNFIWL